MHQSHARRTRVEDIEDRYRGEREERIDDRERARRAIRDLELEMAASELAAPTHRRPRTTGAAANYARSDAASTRRTVQITGYAVAARSTGLRPTPSELRGPRPDRIAAWAVALGLLVAILAALL